MALNLTPFTSRNMQQTKVDPPKESVWGPPDMSKQIQETIASLIPNLQKSYQDTVGQVAREKSGAAFRAAELGRPGGPYGPPAAPGISPGGGSYGPAVPAGGVPAAFTTQDPTAPNLKPHEVGILNGIAGPESGGKYNIRYTPKGGATFDNFDRHPGIFEEGPHGKSSAAGRYQFTKTTWDGLMGPDTPFTPENQDIAALRLARRDYNAKTGSDLDADVQKEGFSPRIQAALHSTWRGIGGSNAERVATTYKDSLGRFANQVSLPGQVAGAGGDPRVGAQPPPPRPRGGAYDTDTRPLPQPPGTREVAAPLPPSRPITGNTDVTESYKQRLVTAFPTAKITSEYRSPEHNARVGGANASQHVQGRAIDISTANLTQEQQQAIVDDALANGAKGIGYYGNSMHIDFRDTGPAAWGPNRSRTSLGATPPWFQERANTLLAGGGGGGPPAAVAGGGGGPAGGFTPEALTAALAQAPPELQAMFGQLAQRVPGGMPTIVGMLGKMAGGMMGGGGGGAAPTAAAAAPPTPASPPGTAQAVAAAAPGTVPRSSPMEAGTASGQNQAPLFATPQLGQAEAQTAQLITAGKPNPGAPGPGGPMPPGPPPPPPAQVASADPNDWGGSQPGPRPPVTPPEAAGIQQAGLKIEPMPQQGGQPPPLMPPPRPAAPAGGGPAAPQQPPPPPQQAPPPQAAPMNLPPPSPAAQQVIGMEPHLQEAIGWAITGGDSATAGALLRYAENVVQGGPKFSFMKGEDGTIYRTDDRGNIAPVIAPPQQGQQYEVVQPGDPGHPVPGDPRPYQRDRKTGQTTPISEPSKPAAPAVQGGFQYNPQTGRYDIPIGPQGQQAPMFQGNSVEAQALNEMVSTGRITRAQAADLATGKSITTPDGTFFLRGSELIGAGPPGQPAPGSPAPGTPDSGQPGVRVGPAKENLPSETSGRLGMGNEFLANGLPTVRKWLDDGRLNTAQGRLGLATGRGEGGDMARIVEDGRDALLRGLTGAGMGVEEARSYAQRYSIGATDLEADVRRKLNALERNLVAVRDAQLAGRRITAKELTGAERDPGKPPAGMPVVKTDEDYEKLKSGSTFVDPDGNVRRKP